MKLTFSFLPRVWLWIAAATLLLATFLIFSTEVREAASGEPELIGTIDSMVPLLFDRIRGPRLNRIAAEFTALGSGAVVTVFIIVVAVLLILKKRFIEVVHLVIAGIGSALITSAMKSYFERPRPDILNHLVEVQGFSYPSGHSLSSSAVYFTFAILLCHHFVKSSERAIVIGGTVLFILLISMSRVYLRVHYVSDVIAGVLLGIGWAAILGAVSSFFGRRRLAHGPK